MLGDIARLGSKLTTTASNREFGDYELLQLLQERQIWSIPAGRHYRGSSKGGTIRYATLFVSPQMDISPPHLPVLAPVAGVRSELVHACVQELSTLVTLSGLEPKPFAEHLLATLVMHLNHRYGDGQRLGRWCERHALAADAAQRLQSFVSAHLESKLSVSAMAIAAGVPSHALTRAVQDTFGMTPWQFVISNDLRALANCCVPARKKI
ncbi:MAG TPA: hypothetical protein PKE00_00620 [Planctomycetota bacterium]|nr:hypothetical protein [Planctomycetota bacterium]